MEGLPGAFWDPGTICCMEDPRGSGGAVWRKSLGQGAASDLLYVMERMVLSVRPVFLLLWYAFKGWSLVLLASSFARSFRCPGILCSHIVCAFRPILGCRYPKCFVWNDILYISLHILAFSCLFLHVLLDSLDFEIPFRCNAIYELNGCKKTTVFSWRFWNC